MTPGLPVRLLRMVYFGHATERFAQGVGSRVIVDGTCGFTTTSKVGRERGSSVLGPYSIIGSHFLVVLCI